MYQFKPTGQCKRSVLKDCYLPYHVEGGFRPRDLLPFRFSGWVSTLRASASAAATAGRRLERFKCFQPLALHGPGRRGRHFPFAARAIRGALNLRAKQLTLQQTEREGVMVRTHQLALGDPHVQLTWWVVYKKKTRFQNFCFFHNALPGPA